jgi:hypothetical protein
VTGIGKKDGVEVGWCGACVDTDGTPDVEDAVSVRPAAGADMGEHTNGGDSATMDDEEQPSAATAGACDGCSATSTDKTFE